MYYFALVVRVSDDEVAALVDHAAALERANACKERARSHLRLVRG